MRRATGRLGAALCVAALLMASGGRANADDAARRLLRRALDHYVAGEYQRAADSLRPLVEARILADVADQREAVRTYGIVLYLTGAKAGAERAFRHLLRLQPAARLDPGFVRPEVVTFFGQVRRRHELELQREARRRGPRGSAMANLLVPWGQFQNGHRKKGVVLLVGEVALAATSIATAAVLYSWRSETGEFGGRESTARALSVVNAVSFSALVALVAYGVIDGLYHYYRGPRRHDGQLAHAPSGLLMRF